MIKPDRKLAPDWDEYNVDHIALHGLRPEQIEEIYYNEGPLPTLAIKNKTKSQRSQKYRYRLWGTDASGQFIEAVIAPYPEHGLWRCVTAFSMSEGTKKAYLKRIKK